MVDASSKAARGSLDVSKRAPKATVQHGDVVRATVGELSFGVRPDRFVGIELRGIGRQTFEMQSGVVTADFSNSISFVNARVVPDDEDVPAKVAQQVSEEFADLVVPDVLRVTPKVQTDPPTPGSNRNARNHRDPIMPVTMMKEGRLTARSPGLSHRGNQEEARLVDEDDVGTQPRSVFFTRGQFVRFQRSMTSSLRSSDRRSGFW